MVATRTTEMLPIPLSQEDLAKKAEELAEAEIELSRVKKDRALVAKQYRDRLETLQGVVDGLAKTVKEGQGDVEVEVELRDDWGEKTLTTVRLDTNEVVHVRPMTDSEIARGPSLPFMPDPAGDDKKKGSKPAKDRKGMKGVDGGKAPGRGRKKSTKDETADLQ